SEMRRYVLSTRAHNTIRVDGQDQNRRLNYNRTAFDVNARADAAWRSAKAYDVVEATYDEGYGPEAARTVSHTRKVIGLKQSLGALGPCLLVIDRLSPNDRDLHDYQVLWHLNANRAEVAGHAVRSTDEGVANLAIVPASVAGLGIALIAGQATPEWQGWIAVKHHQQGEYAPTPTASYTLQASGPVRVVTLLCPTPAGAACPVIGVGAASDVEATAIRLLLADGSEVALDEDDYPLAG
ncbi:MAG: heparinase II/III family protein, partial [Anaerolineae bacterium]|nr:heparinase II/III family protein [Anaerolineae bacterium]